MRQQLEAVERITKKKPKELIDLIALPETMREYWQWFLDLNATRPQGMGGVSSIQYLEMTAYFNLNSIEVEPQEVQIIKMLDSVAIAASREQEEKNKKKT